MITLAFNFNFIHFPFHSTDPIPLSLDFRTLNMFLLLHNSYSILIVTNSVVLNSCVCVCVNSVFEDKVHMPTATKPTAGVHVVAPHHLGNHAAVNIEHHVHDHFAGACVCLSLSLCLFPPTGFTISPGNLWVLERGREYTISVHIFDKNNHKVYLMEVRRVCDRGVCS